MQEKKYIAREIKKVNNLLKRNFEQSEFKKKVDNATGTNSWIIGYLAENQDKDIFQRDLEKNFSIRRSTVSNIIQLMEKKGFIRRESVSYDARLKKIVLTEKALEIYKHMLENIEERDENLRRGISDEEIEVFFDILERIKNNVE